MKEIEYIQVGDYQLPNLKVEEMHLNRFGRTKLDYLKKYEKGENSCQNQGFSPLVCL